MQNIKKYQIRKCIFMSFEDFKILIKKLTNDLKSVERSSQGIIYYEDTYKAMNSPDYWSEPIIDTLSKYFGITVMSVHADNCCNLGIWIHYIE